VGAKQFVNVYISLVLGLEFICRLKVNSGVWGHLFSNISNVLSYVALDRLRSSSCNGFCVPKVSQCPHWPCYACKHSEFTSRIQGDCTNTGVSRFRVFPRPLIDDGDELSTCASSPRLTYWVWLGLPPTCCPTRRKSEWKMFRVLLVFSTSQPDLRHSDVMGVWNW